MKAKAVKKIKRLAARRARRQLKAALREESRYPGRRGRGPSLERLLR